ncbi:MAG: hypothetical protein RMJ56_05060 [Gemmataceae bacterium]|nr:hypothetical protein [Gemmata sp.]MDW8196960.1 hypothetical protein [Gemmataceae bacterium]
MRYQCPRCADYWEAEPSGNTVPRCPRCSAPLRLITTAPTTALEMPQIPPPPVMQRPVYAPPAIVPFPLSVEPREYIEEKVEDLRERRQYRRQQQQYVREDRISNPVGIAGVAINGTAFLLVMSGLLFGHRLEAYGWVMAVLSIPMVLIGLPLSIVGSLRQGRIRMYSWIGVGLGAMLLLLMIPGLMVLLLKTK